MTTRRKMVMITSPKPLPCVQCGRMLRYAAWRLTDSPDLSCGVCAGPVLDAERAEPLPEGEIPGQLELGSADG